MRKVYPYLDDSYIININEQIERQEFLAEIDNFVNQKQYVRITLLTWDENPIKEIEGELASGSLTKDGSSSIRTTCQFTCSINRGEYTVEDSEMDFAINKKIFVEVGIKNYSKKYREFPILWFPQGVFFIKSFSVTSNTSSAINISLNLADKMLMLNGEIGGTFPATTVLDEVETQTPSGEYVSEKVLIYDLIQEMVHHFGGEDMNNIIIEDVPLRVKQVLKWTGSQPLYLIKQEQSEDYGVQVSLKEPANKNMIIQKVLNGQDAGYEYVDFVYDEELVAGVGDSVCTILDKLKTYLGNYEYFYDAFGIFHFREIKNYLNTTLATVVLDKMDEGDYLVDVTTGKSVYNFTDDNNITSITANPQYNNIKNDYVVEGLRKMTGTDISYPVRYHIAIDYKPQPASVYDDGTIEYYNKYYDVLLYEEESTGLKKLIFPIYVEELPTVGNFNVVYKLKSPSGDAYTAYLAELNKIPSLEAQLAKLQEQLAQYQKSSNNYSSEIGEVEAQIAETKGVVGGIEASIKDWQRDLTIDEEYTEEKLIAAELELQLCNLEIQRLEQQGVNPSDPMYQELIEKRNQAYRLLNELTIRRKINDLQQELKAHENQLKELEDKLAQLKLYGDADLAEINNLKKRIQEIQDQIAAIKDMDDPSNVFYYWSGEGYKKVNKIKYYSLSGEIGTINQPYKTQDWRTDIYLRGMLALNNGTDASSQFAAQKTIQDVIVDPSEMTWIYDIYNVQKREKVDVDFYFEELDAFWPEIYDLENQCFYAEEDYSSEDGLLATALTAGNYYLDFIDPRSSQLGEFAVSAIGRRTNVTHNEDINCLFEPPIPDVVYLNVDALTSEELANRRNECNLAGQRYSQVYSDIYYALVLGGNANAAFDQIKYDLWTHTNYQKTISLTALPSFYLEPNSRVTINDKSTNTYGDFMITTISIPLKPGSLMSVNGSECVVKM